MRAKNCNNIAILGRYFMKLSFPVLTFQFKETDSDKMKTLSNLFQSFLLKKLLIHPLTKWVLFKNYLTLCESISLKMKNSETYCELIFGKENILNVILKVRV